MQDRKPPPVTWIDRPDDTLRGKIINTLGRTGIGLLQFIAAVAWEWTTEIPRAFSDAAKRGADESQDPLFRFMQDFGGLPPETIRPLMASLVGPQVPVTGKFFGLIGMLAMAVISGVFVGPLRLIQIQMQRRVQSARASVMQTAQAVIRGLIPPGEYADEMLDMGFSPHRIDWLRKVTENWPSAGYVFELLNRGEIDQTKAIWYLRWNNFSEEAATELLKLRLEIPNIQDLIRFAVREAYTPSAIAELGLHQEFPAEIMPDATKRGLSQKYALDYWAAHWQLPSVTQVFEMFHRRVKDAQGNVFDRDAMARFLKYADYALPWRQMLIDIAYNPYTRRELPRLFRLGVIDQEGMKSAYMDLGLSPERAQVLTDASIREAREASRDLTRADIEAGYKRHLLPPEAAAAALGSMGFDEDEVAYILARVDYDKAQTRVSSRKTTIKRRYVAATIDHVEATRQLAEAGVEAAEIADLLVDWTEERAAKVERPTLATLEQMYRRRLISGPDLASELAGHGYSDRYVQLLIANIEADIAEENAKRTEAERRRQAVKVKLPTKADLLDWLQAGIITQDDMRRRLSDQGYLAEDIDRYLQEEGIVVLVPAYHTEEGRVRVATLKLARRAENITAVELLTGLMDLDMPASLADAIVEYEEVRLGPAAA